MHEIVTLQFGDRANHVATHFWNTQESYFDYAGQGDSPVDHDLNFRPGIGSDGSDTYTPRTLIYDLKDNFGSLRKINALYGEEDADSLTLDRNELTSIQRQPPIEQHPYQRNLDEGLELPVLTSSSIRYWSDYNRVYYHPRSLHPISVQDVPALQNLSAFADWSTGVSMFELLDKEHDFLGEDVRYLAEECDRLQGFQIFADVSDAWGGWTATWLERLRDEYGGAAVWVWGIEAPARGLRTHLAIIGLNNARSVAEIGGEASVYSPLSSTFSMLPDYLRLDSSLWETSAVQASAIESLTFPTRLRPVDGRSTTLSDLQTIVNRDGLRRVAELELSTKSSSHGASASLTNGHGHADHRMTNGVSEHEDDPEVTRCDIRFLASQQGRVADASSASTQGRDHVFGRYETYRGEWGAAGALEETNTSLRARYGRADRPTVFKQHSDLLFPVLSSFPNIFDFDGTTAEEVAVHAALSSSVDISKRIGSMAQEVRRAVGLTVDERAELYDKLQNMAREYVDGWDSGSESEDDV